MKFRKRCIDVPSKPRCFLDSIAMLTLYQNKLEITDKEKSFLDTSINTLASFTETESTLTLAHLTKTRTKKNSFRNNGETEELVDIMILLDKRKPMKVICLPDDSEHQHENFPCLDGECNFSNKIWNNVYIHMKKYHPYQFPSKMLSKNKLNHKIKEPSTCDYIEYIPCQASLARYIQDCVNYLKSNGNKVNYVNIENYLKTESKIKKKFFEIGHGSLRTFIERHRVNLKFTSKNKIYCKNKTYLFHINQK